MTISSKTPIILLTGFLGSGKTTFLNRLLAEAAFRNSLVIVNEFGEVGIDHHLVKNASDTLLELSNGCACCSVRGELVETLASQPLERFDRIIIETTGVADPLPIFQSLAFHALLSQTLKPASIVTVFDVLRGRELTDAHPEAVRQISLADTIILTKTDMPAAYTKEAEQQLLALNQTANIVSANDGIAPEQLETTLTTKGDAAPLDQHASAYQTTVLRTDQSMSLATLSGLLHMLASHFGDSLLRIKGMAKIEQQQLPVTVQVSGNIVHDFESYDHWPDGVNSTQLVVITKAVKPEVVQNLFAGFMGEVTLDSPDRAALMHNPLAVPGF